MEKQELIFDWNIQQNNNKIFKKIELCDETLRDGIQSPSVLDPNIEDKLKLISLMDELTITIADIGLPGAGPKAYADVLAIAKFISKQKLSIKANCAARTLIKDIEPIVRAQQESGIPITCYCFLGSSPIRQLVENWSLDDLKKTIDEAISYAVKENLEVAFVTEDTTRSSIETLNALFKHAINLGAKRLVLCDTVGHATPNGVKNLVQFTQKIIEESGEHVEIDWHGHNDRGLAVTNTLFALEYGCHRVHATALGIGERVGNTSMDQLIVNLKLLDAYSCNAKKLSDYVSLASKACGVSIPYNYPVFGEDSFRTATGVHASAVIKALNQNNDFLADTVYSSVPASWFGKKQTIEIGPMSGASNVKYWLKKNGLQENSENIEKILKAAKMRDAVLKEDEIIKILQTT